MTRLVEKPGDYIWSSAQAHLTGKDNDLVKVAPLLDIISNWESLLATGIPDEEAATIRRHTRTGRPLGGRHFLEVVEKLLGRSVRPQKPGPKPKR